MDDPKPAVKRSRSYDASGRQARAQETRAAALAAAEVLFLRQGYVSTTVESLASAAGVSAATIYTTYGGKAGLVRELCTRALAGVGPVPAEERSDNLRATASAREIVARWAELVTEVSPRISLLLLLLSAAAAVDSDAADLWAELDGARLSRMAENAAVLADRGLLRHGIGVEEARDVLWLCTSPELYELLVLRRGWTLEALRTFVADTMVAALF